MLQVYGDVVHGVLAQSYSRVMCRTVGSTTTTWHNQQHRARVRRRRCTKENMRGNWVGKDLQCKARKTVSKTPTMCVYVLHTLNLRLCKMSLYGAKV